MLFDTFTVCFGILSLVCMFAVLLAIVFDKNRNCIPTLISVVGCIAYVLFITTANMDNATRQMFWKLLFAYVAYIVTAYINYRQIKHGRARSRNKIAEFKHQCFEARQDSQVIYE